MPQIVEKGKGALTHKIGPLPLWGWVVGGAVAVLVVKKVGGRGSGGTFSSSIPIASLAPGAGSSVGDGSLASGGSAVGSPAQNVMGGSDTAPGGTAPWWATPSAWLSATPAIPLVGQPSTNGSSGSGSQTTPKGTTPAAPTAPSWWTRLTSPQGALPAGAAVTAVGNTTYSLSDAALTRSQITGSSPIEPTSPKGATADIPASTNPVNFSRYELN